jgi:hypothetical protein
MFQDIIISILSFIIIVELAWIFRSVESFDTIEAKPMFFEDQPPDFTKEYPATDKTEMTPDEDDGLDIPWIATWTAADKRARRGHNCLATYKQMGPSGTVIITTTKSCEDGMPHTRPGSRIYIPDNINTVMRSNTIRHELVHIFQRRNPEVWKKFFSRSWYYKLSSTPPCGLPKNLIEGRRANPDTTDDMGGSWACWLQRWWTIPIYKDSVNPRLRDTTVIYWDSLTNKASEIPPTDWTSFFGTPGQPEHPNEIAACLLVSEDTSSEAGRRLMTWWSTQGLTLTG